MQCFRARIPHTIPRRFDPWDDKELMLELITHVDSMVHYSRISMGLQHDVNIIRPALKTNPYCLQLLDSIDLGNPELARSIQEAQHFVNQDDVKGSANIGSLRGHGDNLPFRTMDRTEPMQVQPHGTKRPLTQDQKENIAFNCLWADGVGALKMAANK
jgi:hypothetical protein